ncbi:MAG TPA: hypothetical protein VGO83_03835 [Thermoleophilaceae bacterium]|nr:hypothetical protein [Thermoleophilaceae bacterium]
MTTQLIESLRIERETLWVRPCSAFGSRYLADDYWVTYGDGVDLESVSEAVALMPFVLDVAPVAWASGERWVVPELDAVQAASLPAARETFRHWYPNGGWDGELEPERTSETRGGDGPDVLIFSGGLDSTYSALSEPPGAILLLLRGLDVALDNGPGWARVRREAQALADRAGHKLVTAETSLKRHLRKDAVDLLHGGNNGWWVQVQFGLALAGVAIPVAAANGGTRVLVPASLSHHAKFPLGSAPDVEENARWSGGEVVHHGFELTRHDKLRWVLERCDEIGPVFLRVCYSLPHGAGANCLSCEKCLRTALGLMIEGRDPLPFGLPVAPSEVERRVRDGFESAAFERIEAVEALWIDLRTRAQEHPGLLSDGFRDWLLAHTSGRFAGASQPVA